MAFGLGFSFGSKKEKSTTNTTGTKDEVSFGSSSQNTQGTQTQTSQSSSTGSSSTTGNQTTVNSGTQSTAGTEAGQVKSTTTTLASDVQAALTQQIKSILGGGAGANAMESLNTSLATMQDFNAADYVKQAIDSARYAGEQGLQEQQSLYQSNIGGTAGTNSMAALLAARGRSDLESKISTIGNEAAATAAGIVNQNAQTAAGASSSLTAQAEALASVLKGATTTTDQTTLTNQIQQLLNQQTGQTANSQSTQTAEQNQSSAMTIISQLVDALTKNTTNTTATESSTTIGKKSGFGISASI